jgi:chromate transporter
MVFRNARLKEISLLFLKLGTIAFGGPAAHLAMMKQEVVRDRKWMEEAQFLDLMGATNLIPGPNSTEMAIYLGYERGGWKGLILAGACFIMPSVLITVLMAWLYASYGRIPSLQPFLYGIKPAIIAVILSAIYPLIKQVLQRIESGLTGLVVLLLSLFHHSEILLMAGAGFVSLSLAVLRHKNAPFTGTLFPVMMAQLQTHKPPGMSSLSLFLVFLKIGALLYGSGYVLFAFLDTELVATGMISRELLADAIAVGQITPGPVSSAATFIGYQVHGIKGAVLATLGIFLPSFLFVALLKPLVGRFRKSKVLSSFLDGVNAASVALIVAVCLQMGKESIADRRSALLAMLSLVIALSFPRLNSVYVVIGGSLGGYLLTLL